MRNFFALLFLLLFFSKCDSSQLPTPPPAPIELTLNELSAEEIELFFQNFEINDTLKPGYMEIGFLRMAVKNNNYELLCFSLSKIGKSLVYRSDVVNKYRIEDDSLRMM